ncbi:hypothetical protein ABG067_009508, partial [Albugo candida]
QSVYEDEPEIMNDMRAYMDDDENDEAINQVISRMYQKEEDDKSTHISKEKREQDSILSLNSIDYLNLW